MFPETVVTFKWKPPTGYRSTYGPEQVNTLARMVRRHYSAPHRFVCVTDDAEGIDPSIDVLPLWDDHAKIPNPHGSKNPSCYRRLRLFAPEMGAVLGRRYVSLDLDTVILRDVTPLWDRPEDFVAWGDTNRTTHYNGSMLLLTAGARPRVWTEFDPVTSPIKAKAAGFFGSDQGWISCVLGIGEAIWTRTDGVYSFRNHLNRPAPPPENARMVMFHGATDPWMPRAQSNHPWIAEHYR